MRADDVDDLVVAALPAQNDPRWGPALGPALGLAAAAAVVAAVGAALLLQTRQDRESVTAEQPAAPTSPAVEPTYACGDTLPVSVTVPGASRAPLRGPAPGTAPPADGQLVQHWPRPDGSVDVRWPAPTPLVYASGPTQTLALDGGASSQPGTMELDVHPPTTPTDQGSAFAPDVRFDVLPERTPAPRSACSVLELTITTEDGQWTGGLAVGAASTPWGEDLELVDLRPRITERRPVDTAPTEAIPCQGADANGTPPNRDHDPDPSLRGTEPAAVLLAYLATTRTVSPSGWTELVEPDGTITYAIDSSGGLGWTTLLFVAPDANGWYLAGGTSSGC